MPWHAGTPKTQLVVQMGMGKKPWPTLQLKKIILAMSIRGITIFSFWNTASPRVLPLLLGILVPMAVIVSCYLFAPKGYILDMEGLTISRSLRSFKIIFGNIQVVRKIERSDLGLLWSVFGVGDQIVISPDDILLLEVLDSKISPGRNQA